MEKRKVILTLLLEGWIEEFFLPPYFKALSNSHPFDFERDNLTNPVHKESMGKTKNLKRLPFVSQSFLANAIQHKADGAEALLVFGVDLEWEEAGKPIQNEGDIKIEMQRIEDAFNLGTLGIDISTKILFIPIRCFETWIWYLRNPAEERGSFERISNRNLKTSIYGSVRSSIGHSRDEVKRLETEGFITKPNFDRLSTQSPSFKHFNDQILAYLQKIS